MRRYTRQVARSARTGRFLSLDYARRHPATTVIETVSYPRRRRRRRAAGVLTEENQNGYGSPWLTT